MKKGVIAIAAVSLFAAVCLVLPSMCVLPMPFWQNRVSFAVQSTGCRCKSVRQVSSSGIQSNAYSRQIKRTLKAVDPNTQCVLYLNIKTARKEKATYPEIRSVMNCFDVLDSIKTDKEVGAIVADLNSGRFDDATWISVCVSKKDYDAYAEQYLADAPTDIDKLGYITAKWCEDRLYNPDTYVCPTADDGLEDLFSEWNVSASSRDGQFHLYYSNKDNSLMIDRAGRFHSVEDAFRITIPEETGCLRGMWDNDNNIWLFGKETGVSVLKYGGDMHWSWYKEASGFTVPERFAMIAEWLAASTY